MLFFLALVATALAPADTPQPQRVHLTPVIEGCLAKKGGSFPDDVKLTRQPPPALKKPPAGVASPLYGLRKFGPREHPAEYTFILDQPEGPEPRLFVDTDASGDLSHASPIAFTKTPYKARAKKDSDETTQFTKLVARATLTFTYDDATKVKGAINITRWDPADPGRQRTKDALVITNDFGLTGTVTLGEETYDALLFDELANADYRGPAGGNDSGVRLLLDLNRNGVFDRRGESFDPWNPFCVHTVSYEIKDMAPSGQSFSIVRSERSVPEIPIPPDLRPGKKSPAFDGTTPDGKAIHFPADFAGKAVLLHFSSMKWKPSIEDLPRIAEASKRFAGAGLAVLGVSLDSPEQPPPAPADKPGPPPTPDDPAMRVGALRMELVEFNAKSGVAWPEHFDGLAADSPVVAKFMVGVNPIIYLIDADTLTVLASGKDLMGDQLLPTLERILAERAKQQLQPR